LQKPRGSSLKTLEASLLRVCAIGGAREQHNVSKYSTGKPSLTPSDVCEPTFPAHIP
jgi:hypothetical protein